MDPIARFLAYAATFEQAFASDDWSAVSAFFTDDAVYEVFAAEPFGGVAEGREPLLAFFRRSLDTLDRRFDTRSLEILGGPELREDTVWVSWRARYARTGAPDVVLDGEERAWFEGDRIRRLEDRIPDASTKAALEWFASHGARLKPA